LNLPADLPELRFSDHTDHDNHDTDTKAAVAAKYRPALETLSETGREVSKSERKRSDSISMSYTVNPESSKEGLTFVRSIRVFGAVKAVMFV